MLFSAVLTTTISALITKNGIKSLLKINKKRKSLKEEKEEEEKNIFTEKEIVDIKKIIEKKKKIIEININIDNEKKHILEEKNTSTEILCKQLFIIMHYMHQNFDACRCDELRGYDFQLALNTEKQEQLDLKYYNKTLFEEKLCEIYNIDSLIQICQENSDDLFPKWLSCTIHGKKEVKNIKNKKELIEFFTNFHIVRESYYN